MSWSLTVTDCLGPEGLPSLGDNSVDAIVTDPPAGIGFMGRDWDRDKGGRDAWVAWLASVMRECRRVLKPGGHALVWALPRTSHWTGWALEDAGLEVRDCVYHIFGSGFPKSLDVSKAIDAHLGAEREAVRTPIGPAANKHFAGLGDGRPWLVEAAARGYHEHSGPVPATATAAAYDGWGTALKPAVEVWWLARRPLDGTVAANVLRWGTGGLNVDGCRVAMGDEVLRAPQSDPANRCGVVPFGMHGSSKEEMRQHQSLSIERTNTLGRWPAHLIASHSPDCGAECAPGCPVATLDEQSGASVSRAGTPRAAALPGAGWGMTSTGTEHNDAGGASRYFYCPKPSRYERDLGCDDLPTRTGADVTGRDPDSAGAHNARAGATHKGARNVHPTVKGIDLMSWLCRLVTPPGGLILDPFSGSGSTGAAAVWSGFRFVGFEQSAEYAEIARRRIAFWARCAERGIDPREAERGEKPAPGQLSLLGATP